MLVPLSWLRALLPELNADAHEVARRLMRAGLEVEAVTRVGAGYSGVVVGEVLTVDELTGHRKPVRYATVAAGGATPRGVVCGATNFTVGDRVAFAVPGAVLPGGVIGSEQRYGRTSDGMICSARELGLGTDHAGILVLGPDVPVAADLADLVADDVLDVAVTPDRGYALSMRGLAREVATAFELPYADPADLAAPPAAPPAEPGGWPVRIEDPAGCDRYVAGLVEHLDAGARSPFWLVRRLTLAGMRPLSLAVDVTNHVLLELGQPLHAFDRDRLQGALAVRRAAPGEPLVTLDGVQRTLDATDLVIADDAGPLALAGVMGGARAEIGPGTTAVVVESAHFDPATVGRTARRHRIPSEASRRFERGVDPALAPVAAVAAARLLADLAGARPGPSTDVGGLPSPRRIVLQAGEPERLAGRPYSPAVVRRRLSDVGCAVTGDGPWEVVPPTWRPDLTVPADLVEEVARLEGYDTIPTRLPTAAAGRGLTAAQRRRRAVGWALAAAGWVEVLCPPFTNADPLGLPGGDPRRDAVRLANPLAEEEAWLRTSLLPGLLAALGRNLGRGMTSVAVFELGTVFLTRPPMPPTPPPPVGDRPTAAQLAALDAQLPDQPFHVAAVLTGDAAPGGWWGAGRPADWADAVEVALTAVRATGADPVVAPASMPPWHPGRCAEIRVGDQLIGWAGELHPRTVADLRLPARTVAMELDLTAVLEAPETPVPVPGPSPFPPAMVDVALVIGPEQSQAGVAAALRGGAGPLLEELRLFDVYTGSPVPDRHRSLAYTLVFRAPDRTLTGDEANALRDGAVAEAARRTGAVLRG
ncbi:MAG: phenylalanine--tRNA ligase subunit beta [Mycobacteriales bacterium]